jgi:hypothetical protein
MTPALPVRESLDASMHHPLRNLNERPSWSPDNDPFAAANRTMHDFQSLAGVPMKSIVHDNSRTIGILECYPGMRICMVGRLKVVPTGGYHAIVPVSPVRDFKSQPTP